MDKKKEESESDEKKFYVTSENGESQGGETIEVVLNSSSSSSSELPNISNAAPALFLLIGSWQVVPKNEGDLVLRFDYRTKKIAWEIVREGPSKHKIEIDWSNIIGIKAATEDHRQGILQLELLYPPKFYQELKVNLGTHNKWIDGSDFTENQASKCRRHLATFPPGVLNEPFKKLIKSDKRLYKLCHSRFPTFELAYFLSQNLLKANTIESNSPIT